MTGGSGERQFNILLIANRGEIATRVIRTAKRLGYKTIAVYSEADRESLHVSQADQAVCIGGQTAAESYLDSAKILDACVRSGAEAVHPGYGFLSENSEFARSCLDKGLIFIGPDPDAIHKMGNKSYSKELMIAAGVPCIPGYQGKDQSLETLVEQATKIGFPLMVKAAAGGGGRGLRRVENAGDLPALLQSARSEAEKSFGNGELLLEKAITGARHVEIQVFGDRFGHVIHLGERDCSVQRRHQKVFEESPSPAVNADLRASMGTAAVRAARAINYTGAGTVEFLLDSDGHFYFMEMNTRLQVEHPVTELITGLDLVEWQLNVAAGKPLPLRQEQVTFTGHAIEARLYAENTEDNFQPQVGTIHEWSPPPAELARTDHALNSGAEVTPFYDAMLAKVIAWGPDREIALRKLTHALGETVVLGVKTNRHFLISTLRHNEFAAGRADTSFVEKHAPEAADHPPIWQAEHIAAALFTLLQKCASTTTIDTELRGWSSNGQVQSLLKLRTAESDRAPQIMQIRLAGQRTANVCSMTEQTEAMQQESNIELLMVTGNECRLNINGTTDKVRFSFQGNEVYFATVNCDYHFIDVTYERTRDVSSLADGRVVSPSNGLISQVEVSIGQHVTRGTPLCSLESMKLIQTICAPITGTVSNVLVSAGRQVSSKQPLFEIQADGDDAMPSTDHNHRTNADSPAVAPKQGTIIKSPGHPEESRSEQLLEV